MTIQKEIIRQGKLGFNTSGKLCLYIRFCHTINKSMKSLES